MQQPIRWRRHDDDDDDDDEAGLEKEGDASFGRQNNIVIVILNVSVFSPWAGQGNPTDGSEL
jgi:hypothetical protein